MPLRRYNVDTDHSGRFFGFVLDDYVSREQIIDDLKSLVAEARQSIAIMLSNLSSNIEDEVSDVVFDLSDSVTT